MGGASGAGVQRRQAPELATLLPLRLSFDRPAGHGRTRNAHPSPDEGRIDHHAHGQVARAAVAVTAHQFGE